MSGSPPSPPTFSPSTTDVARSSPRVNGIRHRKSGGGGKRPDAEAGMGQISLPPNISANSLTGQDSIVSEGTTYALPRSHHASGAASGSSVVPPAAASNKDKGLGSFIVRTISSLCMIGKLFSREAKSSE